MVIFGPGPLESRQFGGHSFDISLMRTPPNAYLVSGCLQQWLVLGLTEGVIRVRNHVREPSSGGRTFCGRYSRAVGNDFAPRGAQLLATIPA